MSGTSRRGANVVQCDNLPTSRACMRLALFVACLPPSAISRAKPYIILSSPHRTTMLSAGTTFLCVSLLCFSSLCILADDKREAVREEARQVPKQDEEELSLEDRSAQIIREQDAEEGAENPWRDEDLGDVAEPSGIQESAQCLSPSPPDNGFIVGSDFREGAKVHVLCEKGYVLAGPSELTCIACTFCRGGIWSPGEEYSCKPSNPSLVEIRPLKDGEEDEAHPVYSIRETSTPSCPPPKPPEHGYLQGSNYSLDASLHVFCDPGYTLIGQDHITCLRVPDPFKNVVAWQPMEIPTCQIMPPSLLPMGMRGGGSEIRGMTSHRLTDTSPGIIPTEGLPHICFLPKVVGPCQMYLPRFYFDHSIDECTSFVYGGCGGNENNFESMDICQHECR